MAIFDSFMLYDKTLQFGTIIYFVWNIYLLIFYRDKWKSYPIKCVVMGNFTNTGTYN